MKGKKSMPANVAGVVRSTTWGNLAPGVDEKKGSAIEIYKAEPRVTGLTAFISKGGFLLAFPFTLFLKSVNMKKVLKEKVDTSISHY